MKTGQSITVLTSLFYPSYFSICIRAIKKWTILMMPLEFYEKSRLQTHIDRRLSTLKMTLRQRKKQRENPHCGRQNNNLKARKPELFKVIWKGNIPINKPTRNTFNGSKDRFPGSITIQRAVFTSNRFLRLAKFGGSEWPIENRRMSSCKTWHSDTIRAWGAGWEGGGCEEKSYSHELDLNLHNVCLFANSWFAAFKEKPMFCRIHENIHRIHLKL